MYMEDFVRKKVILEEINVMVSVLAEKVAVSTSNFWAYCFLEVSDWVVS